MSRSHISHALPLVIVFFFSSLTKKICFFPCIPPVRRCLNISACRDEGNERDSPPLFLWTMDGPHLPHPPSSSLNSGLSGPSLSLSLQTFQTEDDLYDAQGCRPNKFFFIVFIITLFFTIKMPSYLAAFLSNNQSPPTFYVKFSSYYFCFVG